MTQEADNWRGTLRTLIAELTDRMVKALDGPKGEEAVEQGKETAKFGDICAALDRVCDVYKLLNGTGDLDTSGSALDDYRGRMNGSGHKGAGRAGNRRRGAGLNA